MDVEVGVQVYRKELNMINKKDFDLIIDRVWLSTFARNTCDFNSEQDTLERNKAEKVVKEVITSLQVLGYEF